jgi:aldehyde reductase
MSAAKPAVTLANGALMPCFGFGTWMLKGDNAADMVYTAIAKGCRHIDAAAIYKNETFVGNGIKRAISEGIIKREDLFVTSKCWNTEHNPKDVEPACRRSLKDLGLDYLDLYLVHWPINWLKGDGYLVSVAAENGARVLDESTLEDTWRAMGALVDAGLTKAVGVSNFSAEQLKRVWDVSDQKPVCNQVESHPHWNQLALEEAIAAAVGKGKVALTAYSPLNFNEPDKEDPVQTRPDLLKNATVCAIAEKLGKTPAQVVLRYHIELGRSVIPRTSSPTRLEENMGCLSFSLDAEDVKALSELEQVRGLNPYNFNGEVGTPFFNDAKL